MTETKVKRILLAALLAVSSFIALFAIPTHTSAAINPQINFQGKLTNTDGTNVTNGTYSIRFRIYTSTAPTDALNACLPGSNTCKWEETQASVSVQDGIFQVSLGSVTSLPGSVDFNTASLHLGIKVGADAEMTPRIQFSATPYAFNADKLDGMDASSLVQLSPGAQQTGNINVSGTITAGGTYNGNTFTNAALTFSAASSAAIQSASSQSLNITGNAASTFSTSAGQLTLQSGTGTISFGTTTALTSTGNMSFSSGGSMSIVSATTNAVSLDSGTTGAVDVGTGANAKAITVGNTTSGTTITQKVGLGTTAFSIQGAVPATDTYLLIDATNDRVYIGGSSAAAAPTLFVLGLKSTTGDPTGVNGSEYYNSVNNKFRCYQNSTWVDCSNGFTSITKQADQIATANSVTLQNDNTLFFPVVANTTYLFDAWIPVNATNGTADFKYAITVPAATTFNVTAVANATMCGITVSGTACAYTASNPTTMMLRMSGVATVGATTGNVQFQFAQNTATAAVSSPIIKKGAILSWRKTP